MAVEGAQWGCPLCCRGRGDRLLRPGVAGHLAFGVPYMLARQVTGVALTVGQFAVVARRPLLALTAQWVVLPLGGVVLFHLTADPDLRNAALIVRRTAETTSALVAILAAGSGSVAMACMAGSLALGTLVTPLCASAAVGPAAHVDGLTLIAELSLSVAAPLMVGVGLPTPLPALTRLRSRVLELSAMCVVPVVFVSVGSARTFGAVGVAGPVLPATW